VILLDARMVGARPHGIARYAEGLAPALRAEAPDEEFVALVAPDLPPTSPLAAGRTAVTSIPLYGALEQALLPGLVRRLAPRLLHSLTYSTPLASGVPTIPTIHDLIHLRYPTRLAALQSLYYTMIVGPAARRAPAVITVSAATRDAIAELFRVKPDRIVVTPLAADPRFFAADDAAAEAARGRHGLPSEFVLYVGNPRPHKNAAGALRIRERLAREHGLDVPLVLVGIDEAAAARARAGAGPAPRCIPMAPEADLPGLLRAARALLLPSLDEGFGLPALEGMAAGTPVVAARRGGLPEVVGDAGLLEDPDDEAAFAAAVARVLRDGALAEGLRARGRARAARFTWRETARRTLAAYRSALGEA
jgi:glycosyltransferase involved in cell wall biosynthesis